MDTKKFSIGDIVNGSWAIIKQNVWVFAGTLLGFILLFYIGSYLIIGASFVAILAGASLEPSAAIDGLSAIFLSAGFIIGMLVLLLISCVFFNGFLKMTLNAADGNNADLSAFSTITIKKVVNLFFGYIIFLIATYIGTFLCIIPGLIVYARFSFFAFFIIEKGCNAIDALKESWKCTKGETLNLILLGLVFSLIYFLGLLACGVGALVAIPMIFIGHALVYRLLTGGNPEENVEFESITDEATPLV